MMSSSSEKQVGPLMVSRTISHDNPSTYSYYEPASVHPLPTNLPLFLPYASKQLQLPFVIEVQVKEDEDPLQSPIKVFAVATGLGIKSSQDEAVKSSSPLSETQSKVLLVAEVNKSGDVIHLTLPKGQRAPRVLFRTIALALPYQPHLTKLTIISADYLNGILVYDLAKMLPQSYITELILDDSPVLETNQYLILDSAKHLQRLSLDRCHLCDVGIKLIAAALEPPRPAAYSLKDLSVSSNAITDKGVIELTHMLRINRTLRRLNLSGNQISDKGGVTLLAVLGMFELTQEEKIKSRKQHLENLKEYKRLVGQIFEKETATVALTANFRRAPSTLRARKTLEISASILALHQAKQRLEDHKDPFIKPNVTFSNGKLYCLGNLSLCFLNLAFNNLKHESIVKLIEVLWHQHNTMIKNSTLGCGLLRVLIDGNDPFVSKDDLDMISDLIEKALERRGSLPPKKRRGRESFMSRTSIKTKSKGRS